MASNQKGENNRWEEEHTRQTVRCVSGHQSCRLVLVTVKLDPSTFKKQSNGYHLKIFEGYLLEEQEEVHSKSSTTFSMDQEISDRITHRMSETTHSQRY